MSTSKVIDKICITAVILAVVVSLLFCSAEAFGVQKAERTVGYENRLFDNTKVHTIDLVVDDWEGFLSTCENEQYVVCSAVIDGESFRNIGIRAKGNTSLSSVKQSGSSRYSFKIEFDQYDRTKTYHGLDKLCLNNIIQDTTYMKDYLAYTWMREAGADAPLCSYAYITVNNEDWGLYLAVEAIEESFLQRNYGSDYGDLYKPDSMSFGGGRGNGKEFDMDKFIDENSDKSGEDGDSEDSGSSSRQSFGDRPGAGSGGFPGGMTPPGDFDFSAMGDFDPSEMGDFDPSKMGDSDSSEKSGEKDKRGFGGFGGFGGMGSSDVKLQYVDDDPESYPNIFSSAKTDVTLGDKNRLISALKTISEGGDVSSAVDIDEVLRYFAVHIFLCNGDSYTGQMIHNYYLYEEDGKLSMIPWDYNLAYGSFQGSAATSTVNSPIDTPVSGNMSDRPMVAWIFGSEEYTKAYHEIMSAFIADTDFAEVIASTAEMISEYVKKDPTKFCTYEDFEKGVAAITQFCTLRAESVKGQLEGTIPSTSEGQSADSSALIDASSLTVTDMGSMGGGGGFGGKDRPGRTSGTENPENKESSENTDSSDNTASFDSSGRRDRPDRSGDNAAGKTSDDSAEGSDAKKPPEGFGGDMPQGFPGNMPESGFSFSAPGSESVTSGDSVGSGEEGAQNDKAAGNFPPFGNSDRFSSANTPDSGSVVLLIASGAVLILGLLTAALYTVRKKR